MTAKSKYVSGNQNTWNDNPKLESFLTCNRSGMIVLMCLLLLESNQKYDHNLVVSLLLIKLVNTAQSTKKPKG